MSEAQITLISTIVGAVIGGGLGIVGTYLGSFGLAKRQALREAKDAFIDVFEAIIATIDQNPKISETEIVDSILKKNYTAQIIAMKTLSRRLCDDQRKAFQETWQEYIDPDNSGSHEPFLSYYGLPFHGGEPYDKKYILKAIEHLTSFANK